MEIRQAVRGFVAWRCICPRCRSARVRASRSPAGPVADYLGVVSVRCEVCSALFGLRSSVLAHGGDPSALDAERAPEPEWEAERAQEPEPEQDAPPPAPLPPALDQVDAAIDRSIAAHATDRPELLLELTELRARCAELGSVRAERDELRARCARVEAENAQLQSERDRAKPAPSNGDHSRGGKRRRH